MASQSPARAGELMGLPSCCAYIVHHAWLFDPEEAAVRRRYTHPVLLSVNPRTSAFLITVISRLNHFQA